MALEVLMTAVIDGDAEQAKTQAEKLLAEGMTVTDILNQGMVPAMEEVGAGMETGERFLSEVIMAADTFNQVMDLLKPHYEAEGPTRLGTAVIGTIFGDIHDIGKNLVIMTMEVSGFTVHDLGIDVSPERFVEAVRDHNADIVGISAEISTTMLGMPQVIDALKEAGLRDQVKILVGGPPLTQEYAASIGADGYGHDCFEAVVKARALLGK